VVEAIGQVASGDLAGAAISVATELPIAKAGKALTKTANILGNAQQTRKAGELTTHGSTSQRVATEMAESGQFSSVHMNQTVSTITNGEIPSGVRPDVAGVRRDNGLVDTVEVLSPGQTPQQMTDKLQGALGSRCGSVTCVDPD
jgi:hypothetical protein